MFGRELVVALIFAMVVLVLCCTGEGWRTIVGNRGDGVRVMLCCVFSLSVLVMWSGGVVVVDGNVRISCGRGGRLYVRSHIRVHDWGQGVSMGM